ncbi:MAG: hypothetical protein WCJ19_01325 [bacterium]
MIKSFKKILLCTFVLTIFSAFFITISNPSSIVSAQEKNIIIEKKEGDFFSAFKDFTTNSELAKTKIGNLDLLYIISRLIEMSFFIPMIYFTQKKNRFGKVYDAITKKGIPFIIVNLYEKKTDKFVKSSVTEIDGSFNILIPDYEREYYIEIKQPGYDYIQKSNKLINIENNKYSQYTGGFFIASKEINFMIPLIRNNDENLLKLKFKNIFKNIYKFFAEFYIPFAFLFVLTYCFIFLDFIQLGLFSFYFLFYVYLKFFRIHKNNTYGTIQEKKDNILFPLEDVYIRILKNNRQIIETIITDRTGKYSADFKRGTYIINVYKKGYVIDESTRAQQITPNSISYSILNQSNGIDIIMKKDFTEK